MKAFYLTPAPYAISAIALHRLKVSRFAELNDPFEFAAQEILDWQQIPQFDDAKKSLNEHTGLVCFAADWINPVLWGHYADKHTGMALGFEVSNDLLTKVAYSRTRTRAQFDFNSSIPTIDDPYIKKLASTKFQDWAYEDEWRLFVDLNTRRKEAGLYFYPFSDVLRLVEVVMGPRCGMQKRDIQQLVDGYETPVKVIKSRLASRDFKVVEDRFRLGLRSMGGRPSSKLKSGRFLV